MEQNEGNLKFIVFVIVQNENLDVSSVSFLETSTSQIVPELLSSDDQLKITPEIFNHCLKIMR